ncbi:hypothetical protein NV391_09050 [Companilactobacillus crustorum]|uniref:hypothetical protein n=1 Tax=Companilactobacillus crustorum TaxID=392416 RepID=UPI00237DFBD3|nr:hypothetical protein [Companilactobacillus crustorum]WDT65105.1 hypothetical protein NV391_09050 [Companilactobacillus crustorum]
MKIAIQLNSDRNIIGIYSSPESGAEQQSKIEGWTLVDSDPVFLINNMYEWTVRESDNKLVHKSTGLTPDEETKDAIAQLTKQNLTGQLTSTQIQSAVTALTKQNLQLTQDNQNYKSAITALTQEIASLKLENTNTEVAK